MFAKINSVKNVCIIQFAKTSSVTINAFKVAALLDESLAWKTHIELTENNIVKI